jgi:hypothetical protein
LISWWLKKTEAGLDESGFLFAEKPALLTQQACWSKSLMISE